MQLKTILSNNKYGTLNVIVNQSNPAKNGFVFIFPMWSGSYANIFSFLDNLAILKLQDEIFIYDIDDDSFLAFAKEYNFISHGYGEILFLKEGKIIAKLLHGGPHHQLIIEDLIIKDFIDKTIPTQNT